MFDWGQNKILFQWIIFKDSGLYRGYFKVKNVNNEQQKVDKALTIYKLMVEA